MASFVLETGTTSLAQTYPAATHNSTTVPMTARSAGFGATASKTRSVDDVDAAIVAVVVVAQSPTAANDESEDGGDNDSVTNGGTAALAVAERSVASIGWRVANDDGCVVKNVIFG